MPSSDRNSLEVVHGIGEAQPTAAIKNWIKNLEGGDDTAKKVTPDVPETTVEANPDPLRHPRSSAAAIRLMAILIDQACEGLSREHGLNLQTLPGTAWRPPRTTIGDVSKSAPIEKQFYYEYQIEEHGYKVAAAAGDHLNLSLPWSANQSPGRRTEQMIRLTGMMRLIGVAPMMALTSASPLYYSENSNALDPHSETTLTPWNSARLAHVWPGRTIMDVSSLWRSPHDNLKTLREFTERGILLFGRDIWLLTRAQAGEIAKGKSFQEACEDLKLDLQNPIDRERAKTLLIASFQHGPHGGHNPHRENPQWQAIERWRQDLLKRMTEADRNRVELRFLETPPHFEEYTPYKLKKGVNAFLELLMIYLSQEPEMIKGLAYDEPTLQAAKESEQLILNGDLDQRIYYCPTLRKLPARDILEHLLNEIAPLAEALGRNPDLEIIWSIVQGELLPPALKMREEIGKVYGIKLARNTGRILPNDDYPHELLRRNRAGRQRELAEIRSDLPSLPQKDQEVIQSLLELIEKANQKIHVSSN